jgi:dienelactone hydrolase
MDRRLTDRRDFLALAATALSGSWASRLAAAQETDTRPPLERYLQQLADEALLQMQFRGTTAEECRQWQDAFTKKLQTLLGPYQPPRTWKTVVERTVELDGFRREELLLQAKDHPPLPVHLLLPKGKPARPRPGMVALHGHGAFGPDAVVGRELTPGVEAEIKHANYDYGRQLVRRGYVVAAPCLTPFGRRLGDRKAYGGNDPCAVTFVRLQLLGKVLMAENLRDALWSLELLAGHEAVDAKRLGCVGLSYGGRMTMLTAALDQRVRAAVISGAMNCMQERVAGRYSCGAQVIPGLLPFGDVPEIASLIAPRPSLWEVGRKDALMVPRWVAQTEKRIGRAYAALEAKDQFQVDRFDGEHRWNGERAYRLLEEVLKPGI